MRLNVTGEFLDGFFLRIAKDSQVIFDSDEVKKSDLKLDDITNFPLDGRPAYYELRPELSERFAVYCHEYWHYLISISTLSRLRDLEYLQNVVTLFSKTLNNPKQAVSEGRTALSQIEIEQFRELRRLHQIHDGLVRLPIASNSISLEEHPTIIEDNFNLRWGPVAHRSVLLRMQTRTSLGNIIQPFNFGIIALEEGLTSAVTRSIWPEAKLPQVPYGLASVIAEDAGYLDLTNYEISSLITLSLLTLNPPIAYLDMLQSYSNARNPLAPKEGLMKMWDDYRHEFEQYIPIFKQSLDQMVKRYEQRGVTELAARYVREVSFLGLQKRLEDPLFELKPFEKNAVDLVALNQLFDEFPPCNVVQEREGHSDDVDRDILSNRDIRNFDWNTTPYAPGEFLTTLACNFDFAKAHADVDFEQSDNVHQCCPFYTCCTNERRINDRETCKTSPWMHFKPDETKHCWYGEGAMALRWSGTLPNRE